MTLKITIQGVLIYQTMGLYLLALIATLMQFKRTGWAIYALGFIVSLISITYRWHHVGHPPLQNLFEVFLFFGTLPFPLSVFYRKVLKIDGQAADMFLGAIVLFPAGFIFSAEPMMLPPALQSPLFIPHVAVYMLAYMIMAKAAAMAIAALPALDIKQWESDAYRIVCFGFPFLTFGLVLGSVWAKLAWGDFWGWDPKEMWSLATWLVYLGYFHHRYIIKTGKPKSLCLWVIVGFVFIIITLLWVNLSRLFPGLHNYAT